MTSRSRIPILTALLTLALSCRRAPGGDRTDGLGHRQRHPEGAERQRQPRLLGQPRTAHAGCSAAGGLRRAARGDRRGPGNRRSGRGRRHTGRISVRKSFRGKRPVYRASEGIGVILHQPDDAGELVSAAIGAGATGVSGPNFFVGDTEAAFAGALAAAFDKAKLRRPRSPLGPAELSGRR